MEGKKTFALSMEAGAILPLGVKLDDSKLHSATKDLEITGRGGINYWDASFETACMPVGYLNILQSLWDWTLRALSHVITLWSK